jgi:16S rRNA (guanine1516-N2)-methyltransferase
MQDEIACDFSCSHVIDVIPFNVDKTMTYALGIRKLPEDSRPDSQRQRSLKSLIRKAGSPSPFIVDFCPTNNSRLARRSVGGGGGTDMLVKAVGPKKEVGGAIVYDLTAGFGQDSLVLLQNGASSVTMVERDPIVAALLQDAYRRLKLSTNALAIELSERMKISVGDSAEILKILTPDTHPHICYLDPMFPLRTKSSAVKKNMQILHSLLGTQEAPGDSETQQNDTTLLDAALEIARKRVVVKRPINGRPLLSSRGVMPSFDFRGSVNRFDVYITA